MSAKTAIHIVAVPNTAITRNTLLMPSARLMFCQRMACVRLDSRTVSATRWRLSFMITTSAASIAVSVPAAPMANPISDCASAGASLMPSPVMPVAPYCFCISLMTCSLASGRRSPRASVIPASAAMAFAVAALSPVSMTGVTPSACRSMMACLEVSLMVSATAKIASTRVSSESRVSVRPCCSCRPSSASSSALQMPASCTARWLLSIRRFPSMVPSTPRPGSALKSCTSAASARLTAMALETGWSERAARLAAACLTVASSAPSQGFHSTSFGLPSVMVPVLSKAMAFSSRASSR